MRFRFVEAEKVHYPIRLICRCLAVSRSGYYAWRTRPPSARARSDARLRVEIAASHTASRRTYGSPRILRDLRAEGHRPLRLRLVIDVHVHSSSQEYLRRMLGWGVTSVHLMPRSLPESPVEMERRSEAAEAPTPRLQVTPMFAGAFPDNLVPDTYEFLKPKTPDEAREAVRKVHEQGYRQIKIIQDNSTLWASEEHRSPLIPEPVFEALVQEARAKDMRIYVHATQLDVARTAIASGVDAFMHGTMDEQLTSEDWRAMQEVGMAWTPALNALFLFGDQGRYARRLLADSSFSAVTSREQLAERKAHAYADQPIIPPKMDTLVEHTDAYVATIAQNNQRALRFDVPVAVGSDGGPGGLSTQLELELLQENGMSPTEVLTAATYGGAATMGWEEEVGSVEVGKLADLVILEAVPRADIRNCRKIAWVIKGGNPYSPEALFMEGH